ncbi:MAG: hypothetical protein DRQ49_19105 [Gammaproteobacteria bacterium]|nr:MAG: hypothetical protein DRQ49_19105 [Gammaproteobacteria bacterium]RKZ42051.1 MAG: hypothetical protein DRQ41_07470 [Gammaproteobacteria bacterium]
MAGNVNTPVILGGFPKIALNKYIGQLVRAGLSVAVALQVNVGCVPRTVFLDEN